MIRGRGGARGAVREYFRLRPRTAEQVQDQVDEEIALHIELRARELVARGLDPAAARVEAERRFGGLAESRLRLGRDAAWRERRLSVREWLFHWRDDITYTTRALAREGQVALVIIVTLGLGLGASATMFSIVDRLLLRGPAHIAAPEQVKRMYVSWPQLAGGGETTTSMVSFAAAGVLRETGGFEDVAVYRFARARFGRGETGRDAQAVWAGANLFGLLGVSPALGRFFDAEEDRPGSAQRVAVLSYEVWQREFGGRARAVGESIVVDDHEYTIAGVAPREFTGPELRRADVWLPFSAGYEPRPDWQTTFDAEWTHVLVRLKPDVPAARAEAAATSALRAAMADAGRSHRGEVARVTLLPATHTLSGVEPTEYAVARWLTAVSLIVLLVACANVVNLLVARAVRRRRELSVRLALGIPRARLVRLLMTESLLLAGAGGVLAVVITGWGGRIVRATLLPDVAWQSAIDARVLVFSAVLVLVTGVVVGVAPALHAGRQDVGSLMRGGAGGGRGSSRLRSGLMVVQAALALVLLVGGAHFLRSLWQVHALDLGVRADRVLAVSPTFGSTDGLPEAERKAAAARRATFYAEAIERLRGRTDVVAAAQATSVPLQGTMTLALRVPGHDTLPRLPGGGPFAIVVDGGYFETVGTRILEGRAIEEADVRLGAKVTVINEPMARALWPDGALDRCVHMGPDDDAPCYRVIGVAQETRRWRLVEEPAMQYYVPLEQGRSGGMLLVRPTGRATAFIPELRAALHGMEPALDRLTIQPLSATLDPQVRPWLLGTTMFLVFGGLALAIAAIGLYSIIAYAVAQRRSELAVRIALGARGGNIVGMIMRQALLLVGLGIVVGVPLALVGGRRIEGLLFETETTYAPAFLAVIAVLLVVGVLASVIPAGRAARVAPLEALRVD